jgi:hypothetical protein
MVITDKFVYVHMPKTGGTFVEAVLQRLSSGTGGLHIDTSTERDRRRLRVKDQHQRVSEIPEAHREKPLAFSIRNPYDHHVSFYEFGWWRDHPGDTFDEKRIRLRHPHYPELTFTEYMESVFDWELLDPGYADPGVKAVLRDAGVGPLTFDYVSFLFERPERVIGDLERYLAEGHRSWSRSLRDVRFLRAEDLNRELYEFLIEMGYGREQVEFVLGLDRIYPDEAPRRGPRRWQDYYDPSLTQLVKERERAVLSMFPEYDN